jgi:hypothetical protein
MPGSGASFRRPPSDARDLWRASGSLAGNARGQSRWRAVRQSARAGRGLVRGKGSRAWLLAAVRSISRRARSSSSSRCTRAHRVTRTRFTCRCLRIRIWRRWWTRPRRCASSYCRTRPRSHRAVAVRASRDAPPAQRARAGGAGRAARGGHAAAAAERCEPVVECCWFARRVAIRGAVSGARSAWYLGASRPLHEASEPSRSSCPRITW